MNGVINNENRIDRLDLIAVFVIAAQLDFFYLLSTEFKLGQGLLLVLSLYFIMRYLLTGSRGSGINRFLMVYLGVLLVTGAYQATKMFGGSVLAAFLAERGFWVYIIAYFALEKLFAKKILTNDRCIRVLGIACGVQLFMYYTQWLVSSKVIFLNVLNGARYGTARFFFLPIFMILFLCFNVSDFFNRKFSRASIIWIVLILGEILIVQKYRMTLVCIAAAVVCVFLLYRGKFSRGLAIICVGLVALVVILNTQMGRDIINSLMGAGHDNSLNGRTEWRMWAFEELKQRPLLGNGYTYTDAGFDYGAQYIRKHFGWNFSAGDYGVFGLVYEYGLLGLGWFVFFVVTQLKRAFTVWKYKKNYAYLIYIFFIIINSYSEFYWFRGNGLFATVIFMCMLNQEYKEVHRVEKVDKFIRSITHLKRE
ncbi:MAG: O-antigen ligase family protein [Lachnospiraceae bacterium]|nr:O-antigen ligase family protein [Lachnospiraceae bacterium]